MVDTNIDGPRSWDEKGLSEKQIKELIREEIRSETAESLSRQLIKRLHFAIQKGEMYGANHPISVEASNQAYYFLSEFLNRQPTITLTLSKEDKILVDDIALPDDYFTQRFAKDFDKHNIVSLTFYRDIEFREMTALVHFLERRIGPRYKKEDIADYFDKEKVTHIEVNKFRYEMIRDQEFVESAQFFKKEQIGKLFNDYPEILHEIVAGEVSNEQKAIETADSIREISENDIIDRLIHNLHRRILGESNSAEDQLIDELIDELESSLSEQEKTRLREKLQIIRDDMLLDSGSSTSKLIDDNRRLKKLEYFREFQEYIKLIIEGKDPQELQINAKAILGRIFSEADLSEVEHVYGILQSAFVENGDRALLWACPPFVDVLFEKCPQSLVNEFVDARMRQKSEEKEFGTSTPISDEMLFWILSNLVKLDKLMNSLKILKIFEEKISDEDIEQKLKEDANGFFEMVLGSNILSDYIDDIDKFEMDVPAELQEIIKILDSEKIAQKVLEKAEKRDKSFAVKAAKAVKVIQKNASVVFAKEVRDISKVQRGPLGEVPDPETKKRATAAIIALSIVAGEAGISFLESNVEDTDPDIREAALDAISRIKSPKAVNILVRYLYRTDQWEKKLENFMARMDEETTIPMLVKFFHLRKDKWIDIIRIVGKIGGDEARRFILDTLDTWTFYTSKMPIEESENFAIALLEAIRRFPADAELIRAVRFFKSEWRNDDLARSIFSFFKSDGDRVSRLVNEILAEWKEEIDLK